MASQVPARPASSRSGRQDGASTRLEARRGDARLLEAAVIPSFTLRQLLRTHLCWLFAGASVLTVALVIPTWPWYYWLLRLPLALAGGITGAVRLAQINGILRELTLRAVAVGSVPEHHRDSPLDTPPDAVAEPLRDQV